MSEIDSVSVELSKDEALVLFDLLHRWEDAGDVRGKVETSEQAALWGLSAALESLLVEPFATNYQDLVRRSRQRLLDRGGA